MNLGDLFTSNWIGDFWNAFGLMLKSLVGMTYNGQSGQMEFGQWVPMLLFSLAITVAAWIFDGYLKMIDYPTGDAGVGGLMRGQAREIRSGGVIQGVDPNTVYSSEPGSFHPKLNPWGVAMTDNAHLADPDAQADPFANSLPLTPANGFPNIPALPQNGALITADDHLFGSDQLEGGA